MEKTAVFDLVRDFGSQLILFLKDVRTVFASVRTWFALFKCLFLSLSAQPLYSTSLYYLR